jgi:hypothetical protein
MRFCEFEKCKYPVFGTDKITGKGYCRSHQTKRTDYDRRTIIQKAMAKQSALETKVRSLNSLPANKEQLIGKGFIKDENLELWFRYQMQVSEKICDNCNKGLYNLNEKEWRGSQHHVYEKALFPSLKAHPKNHLVIGFYCCHGQVHTSILNLSKMNIFPIVKKILLELYPELPPNEQAKARKLYENYIELNKYE